MTEPAPAPSLLDWLQAAWAQPLTQRVWRFGLALLAAGWGLYAWLVDHSGVGYFGLGLGLVGALWGAQVRGGNAWTLPLPAAGQLPETPAPIAWPPPIPAAQPVVDRWAWFIPLRLPIVLGFALLGQFGLANAPAFPWESLGFYGLALFAFGLVIWREGLLRPAADAWAGTPPVAYRLRWLAAAVLAGAAAFLLATHNRFTPLNVGAWLFSVGAWLLALLDFTAARAALARGWAAARAGVFQWRLGWTAVALLAVLAAGAYFRFSQIEVIPPEMTSDHVEKLLDVADLELQGQTKIFFERNTGREPLQFYWTAWIGELLGTGISYLSLKIGTALIGLLTLPYIFLLGREVEDDLLGLLAAALTAVSFWHTAISRVGLRFPLYPVFVAPVLYYLLRGLRRGGRNDFLLAGLFLGIGLYGYSPIRVLPVAVAAIVGVWLLRPAARGRRGAVLLNTALLFATTLLVFLPLLRYMTESPEMFWLRTMTRLSDAESPIASSPLVIFLQNNWNALLMFNYRGDEVWVNTLPGRPALDLISGALLVLGAAFLLARFIARRDWMAGALLLAVPILLLPSTLSIAFPNENPSVVRTGGAIPIIFLCAAYPLWLLIRRVRWARLGQPALWTGALTTAALLTTAAGFNQEMYFVQYPAQYLGGAQNASEIGQVIHDFARSFGAPDTAWVRPYPYWVDTRAVGMYAGEVYHDYAIQAADLPATAADPRAKLFILHPDDIQGTRSDGEPATLPQLRRLYPDGRLSVYHSARPNRDFLIFFVPAQAGFGEQTQTNP